MTKEEVLEGKQPKQEVADTFVFLTKTELSPRACQRGETNSAQHSQAFFVVAELAITMVVINVLSQKIKVSLLSKAFCFRLCAHSQENACFWIT